MKYIYAVLTLMLVNLTEGSLRYRKWKEDEAILPDNTKIEDVHDNLKDANAMVEDVIEELIGPVEFQLIQSHEEDKKTPQDNAGPQVKNTQNKDNSLKNGAMNNDANEDYMKNSVHVDKLDIMNIIPANNKYDSDSNNEENIFDKNIDAKNIRNEYYSSSGTYDRNDSKDDSVSNSSLHQIVKTASNRDSYDKTKDIRRLATTKSSTLPDNTDIASSQTTTLHQNDNNNERPIRDNSNFDIKSIERTDKYGHAFIKKNTIEKKDPADAHKISRYSKDGNINTYIGRDFNLKDKDNVSSDNDSKTSSLHHVKRIDVPWDSAILKKNIKRQTVSSEYPKYHRDGKLYITTPQGEKLTTLNSPLFIPEETALTKGNKLSTITNPQNEFILSFKLNPKGTVYGFSNIFRFTNTNNDYGTYGEYWLMLGFHSGSYTMQFLAGSVSAPTRQIYGVYGVQGNRWNDIQVVAAEDTIKLYLNGVEKGTLPNTNRPQLSKVDVYAGDNVYTAPNAHIKDFKFTSFTLTNGHFESKAYGNEDPYELDVIGSSQIVYKINDPIPILDNTVFSFNCKRTDDVNYSGICINDKCFRLDGNENGHANLPSTYRKGTLQDQHGASYSIPFSDYSEMIGEEITSFTIIQEGINSGNFREKISNYDFIGSSSSTTVLFGIMHSSSYDFSTDPNYDDYFLCGLKFKEDTLQFDALWCHLEDWDDQENQDKFGDNTGKCAKDEYIYAFDELQWTKQNVLIGYGKEMSYLKFSCRKRNDNKVNHKEIMREGREGISWSTTYSYTGRGYEVSDMFSEENQGRSDEATGPIFKYYCSGTKCDNNQFRYTSDNLFIDDTSSMMRGSHLNCPEGKFIRRFDCDEGHCRNLNIWCATIRNDCERVEDEDSKYTSGTIHTKDRERVLICPEGKYLTGISKWDSDHDMSFRCHRIICHNVHNVVEEETKPVGLSDAFVSKIESNQHNLRLQYKWIPCGEDECKNVLGRIEYSDIRVLNVLGAEFETNFNNETAYIAITLPDDHKMHNDLRQYSIEANVQISTFTTEVAQFNDIDFVGNEKITLEEISPGKRYDITLLPLDNDQTIIADLNTLQIHAVIPCSCEKNGHNFDETGQPINLKIQQEKGFVFMEFVDNSKCEKSFMLQRRNNDDSKGTALAPNFQYFATEACGDEIAPGPQYADDLSRSRLGVGTEYRYCVSAVAENYMAELEILSNNVPPLQPYLVSSKATCESHVIKWESSIDIVVALRKDSGSLPVENATVSWTLLDSDGTDVVSNSSQTEADGLIHLDFQEDGTRFKNNDGLFILKISVSKQSPTQNEGAVDHKFLCDDETIQCPTEHITYLKHLEFDNRIIFADDTSVPVEGNIYVKGTDYSGNDKGCPIKDVDVCLLRRIGNAVQNTGACFKTSSDGAYSLPATIGTVISLQMSYFNHSFEAIVPGHKDALNQGILINPSGHYNGYDFHDTNETHVNIEVAGGACNHRIGEAKINVGILGCEWSQSIEQHQWRELHLLPSHHLTMKIEEVKWGVTTLQHIEEYFKHEYSKRINLLDIDESEEINIDNYDYVGHGICSSGDIERVAVEESLFVVPVPTVNGQSNSGRSLISKIREGSGALVDVTTQDYNLFDTRARNGIVSDEENQVPRRNLDQSDGNGDTDSKMSAYNPLKRIARERSANLPTHSHFESHPLENLARKAISSQSSNNESNVALTYFYPDDLRKSALKDTLEHCGKLCLSNQQTTNGAIMESFTGFEYNETSTICSCYVGNGTLNWVGEDNKEESYCYKYLPGSSEEKEFKDKTVRFQYNGTLAVMENVTVSTELSDTDLIENEECRSECSAASPDTCTKHVIRTGEKFSLDVTFYNRIISGISGVPEITCDIVHDEVQLKNEAGPDARRLRKLQENGEVNDEQLDYVNRCSSSSGCNFNVTYDDVAGRSCIYEDFLAGPPEQNAKMLIHKSGAFAHTLSITIVGAEEKPGSESVQYPTHKPLLIIRDPPGGNSYVKYENMVTTVFMRHNTLERFTTYEANLLATLDQGKLGQDACVGVGAAVCNEMLKADRESGLNMANDQTRMVDYHEDSQTFQFTSIWSYSTSEEDEFAGVQSDVALVANIDIKFMETVVVKWHANNCTSVQNPEFAYDLASEENKQAFSFFSFYKIENDVLPKLKELLTEARQTKKPDDVENFLMESTGNWETILDQYKNTTERLQNAKPVNTWFTRREEIDAEELNGAEKVTYDGNNLDVVHEELSAGLVPKEFESAEEFPTIIDAFENKKNFAETERIQFSGGGNLLELTLQESGEVEEVSFPGMTLLDMNRHSILTDGVRAALSINKAITAAGAAAYTEKYIESMDTQKAQEAHQSESSDQLKDAQVKAARKEAERAQTQAVEDATDKAMKDLRERGIGADLDGPDAVAKKNVMEEGSDKLKKKAGEEGIDNVQDQAARSGVGTGPEPYLIGLGVSMALDTMSYIFDNENKDFALGFGGDAETAMAIMGLGPTLSGDDMFKYHESRRSIESMIKSKESSVSLILGDPNQDDEFVLDIFVDPDFGTFIFNTTSGISSCPWEGTPTKRLENPQITSTGVPRQNVPGDYPILFNIEMKNKQDTTNSYTVPLEVLLDPSSNLNDLRVEMFGTDLQNPHQMNFIGSQPITATLAVFRGPESYDYDPLKISLRSQCEALWPITTANHEKVLSLSNDDDRIKFIEPCPSMRLAGEISYEQKFLINKNSEESLSVTIFNMDAKRKLDNLKVGNGGRLNNVYLFYKKYDEVSWRQALFEKDEQLQNADFLDTNEDAYGYATVDWKFTKQNIQDGRYNIMVKSICTRIEGAPNEHNEFSTDIIEGFIDRKEPTLYGQTSIEKNRNVMNVADEIIIHFSEDIKCEKPYTFILELFSSFDKTKKLDKDNFLILCEKNTILFHIEPDKYDDALSFPSPIKLNVSAAEDLAGNMMETMHEGDLITFEFSSENERLLKENNMQKGAGCDGVDQDNNGIIDDCSEDKTPPSISIQSVPIYDKPGFPDVPFLRKEFFSTVDEAKSFLKQNLLVTDDCSNDLNIDISTPEASCDLTMFDVKVTDPRCGEANPYQTVSKKFLLRVDNQTPKVSVGFHPTSRTLFYDTKKNILVVEESRKNLMNVKFWYKAEDNCKQRVKVDVTVKSNEKSFDKAMTVLVKREGLEQESQLQVYVEPSSCKTKEEEEADDLCEWNQQAPIRFYEIYVKATDYGGHVANSTATVVVIPKKADEDVPSKQSKQEGLYDEKYLERIIAKESKPYILETIALEWDII